MKQNESPIHALIIRTAGTNCEKETRHALTLVGAKCDVVHFNQLLLSRVRLHPYQMIVFPGGFSYGDDISAGKVWANEVRLKLRDQFQTFIDANKIVIGVCNGFQVLVKTGILPGFQGMDKEQTVTLGLNDSARFQCEWVRLDVNTTSSPWLKNMPKHIELPIAHSEGKFIPATPKILQKIKQNNQVAFRYHLRNPNGSEDLIAGLANRKGNVVGLMPHPERFMTQFEHPNWTKRKEQSVSEWGDGYYFWKGAVDHAKTNLN